jgi:dihydropyrimidine dehydrogenase (NAD+) subunit PreT
LSKVDKPKYTAEAMAGYNHRTAMEEAARCLLCHDAPCSKGCPAGTNPGDFIRSIRFRNVKGAAEIIRENNVLGGTCARVCPYDRLCEEYCSRCGIDKPIKIGELQRYAIDQEKIFKMKTLKAPAKKMKQTVACVGAGPASLACAAELAKAGYKVTIFEREEKPGGVLTYGIAPSRLPQAVVDHDIAQVKGLGVKFELGKKVKAADLEGFDAIFLGTGLWGSQFPSIPGVDLKGSYAANEYLKKARSGAKGFNPGKKVVVIGGGDVAVDCAVTAKLLGAEDVKIVYRRTLEEAPGNMTEFQYALSLGIGITTNMAPAEVIGTKKVEAIAFNGRAKVCEKSGLKLEADTVVFAIGQGAEDVSSLVAVDTDGKGMIKANKNGKTSVKKYFAAGDIVNGGKTVVQAVADGKAAAAAMVAFLEKGVK